MISPYTGKEMTAVYEKRTWKFRDENYDYIHTAYKCEDTGELFTTCESDDAGFLQVTNQYRTKYGIPFTDEIKDIRERYGVSAKKMSEILGMGVNQWRLYENGDVPSISNGRMIHSITNPDTFLEYVKASRQQLGEKDFENISNKVQQEISNSVEHKIEIYERRRIFNSMRGVENGYSATSLLRLKNIMLMILNKCGATFCTKMNKLLFYIDFLSYRQRGVAMSGLSYRAIEHGPVPDRWDKVYSEFDEIIQETRFIGGYEGNILIANANIDESILSDEDKKIINNICEHFKNYSSKEISEISHKEPAWIKYQENHSKIPFSEAFNLVAI